MKKLAYRIAPLGANTFKVKTRHKFFTEHEELTNSLNGSLLSFWCEKVKQIAVPKVEIPTGSRAFHQKRRKI